MKAISWFAVFLLSVFFSGCMEKAVLVDQVIIMNMTEQVITDVLVEHEPTGKSGATNRILPGKTLEIGISDVPLRARKATISWRDSTGVLRQGKVFFPGEESEELKAMSLVYSIVPGDKVYVHLQGSDSVQ